MYCTIGSDVAVGIVGLQPQACVRPLLIDTNIGMGEERHPVVRHPSGQRNRHIRHVARLAHQRSLSVHSYNVDSRAAYLSKDTIVNDTVNCKLTDRHGNASGTGVNFHQYRFPITELQLQDGDSIHIRVRHDMKREILPGISDVGISLRRK